MIKIYVQNKILYLVDKINPGIEEYLHSPETIFIDELNSATVKTILHELEQPQFYRGIFLHKSLQELINAFKSHLTVIEAAGGLVHTPEKDLLLIFRRGKWDLPKGKLDEGEDLESCALREIEEETGAKKLKVEQPLLITYHTYYEKTIHVLKESHWFLVSSPGKTELKAQTEEDIEQCIWVPMNEASNYQALTYPSVNDVLQKGMKLLQNKN